VAVLQATATSGIVHRVWRSGKIYGELAGIRKTLQAAFARAAWLVLNAGPSEQPAEPLLESPRQEVQLSGVAAICGG